MASTYSNLKIELIGTGEQTGTWGDITNDNFSIAFQEAITGSADVAFSSADVTVTLTDTNQAQTARNLRLNLTGTSGGARQLILGSGCQIEKLYLISNGLADAVTVKNTSGTGIAVPAGKSMFVFNNGTNVVDAVTHLSSLTLGTALPVASGGTGLTTLTANNVLIGNGTSNVAFVAPGTSGNVLISNGTTWVSGASFVTGMIMLWSGSIATIPTGWLLCDGTSGTPDLRSRFIVGAGSTYAVAATGGSADAIVVSHNHTAASTASGGSHQHFIANNSEAGNEGTLTSSNTMVRRGSFGSDYNYDFASTSSAANIGLTSASDVAPTVATTIASNGSSGTNANLPPYFALAYIMKL